MPNRRIPTHVKLLKGTYLPCRAQKPADPGLEPLPEPTRRVPAGIRRQAPHVRASDQFMVEILASLMHEFRNYRQMQAARIGLILKLLGSLYMTPQRRQNIPPVPEPNEYDWL